jgi:hypothetical protein
MKVALTTLIALVFVACSHLPKENNENRVPASAPENATFQISSTQRIVQQAVKVQITPNSAQCSFHSDGSFGRSASYALVNCEVDTGFFIQLPAGGRFLGVLPQKLENGILVSGEFTANNGLVDKFSQRLKYGAMASSKDRISEAELLKTLKEIELTLVYQGPALKP